MDFILFSSILISIFMSLISDLRPRLAIPSLGDTTLGPGFADVDVGTAVVTGASRLGGQLVAHLLDLAIQTLILLPDDGYAMGMKIGGFFKMLVGWTERG